MTKKLEELLNLPDSKEMIQEAKNNDKAKAAVVDQKDTFRDIAEFDKIAAALPIVKGLGEKADAELNDIAQRALQSYEDLMDLGMNVESRYSGRVFEVAGSMLKTSLDAKTAKLDKKLKMVDLQLKKANLDQKAKAMTKIAGVMNVLNDLDEEVLDNIFDTVSGKKGTSKKSKGAKGEQFDPFGDGKKKKKNSSASDNLTNKQKEKILRAFAENAVNVPAVAREQEVTLEEFEFWNELNIDKDLFFTVYNSSWMFKDRIDTIYGLCEDENYLIEKYLDKLMA